MRNSYLICYDISDDKRLRRVFKTMRAWGDHIQFSVFECQLTPADLVRLRADAAESQLQELQEQIHAYERLDRGRV